jgi:ferredoxin
VDAAALARLAALAQAEPRLALPPQLGGYPVVDRWRCTACGACAQLCPTGAASLGAAGEGLEIEVARCIRCAICVTTCPDHALSLGAVAEGGQTVSAGPLVLTVAPNRDPREARIPIEAALALGPRAAELAPKHAAFMPAQRGPVDPAWRPPTTELVTPAIAEGAPGWEDALDRANALATTRAAAARPQRIPIVSEELPFCNDNCLHCGVAELMKVATVPPLPQIVQRLEALAPRSGGRVMFAVSELTLRADFVDILVAASRAGLHTIAVVTNGRLFADRGFTARAVRAGITHALVSLHGPTARTHQALTRTPASFEQTIKGLRELLRRRGEVTVMTNTVITKQNARHLPQLVELAAGLGVENMNLSFVQIVGNAARYRDVVVPRLGEVQGDLRSALDVGTAMGLEMGVSGLPYCALKGYERHFGVDDLTYIDSGAPPDAFEAVSAADAERAACGAPHSLPGACRLCALVAVCPGPQPEYLAQFGAGDLDPYPGPRWTLRPPSRIVAAVFPGLTAERGPAP